MPVYFSSLTDVSLILALNSGLTKKARWGLNKEIVTVNGKSEV
jgi:hypothetical protein